MRSSEPASLRVRLTAAQVAAYVDHGRRAGGRRPAAVPRSAANRSTPRAMPAPDSTDPAAHARARSTRRLRTGEIEVLGRMPWSSNATFLVEVGRRSADDRGRERHAAGDLQAARGASGRSGTSLTGCTSARSRPTAGRCARLGPRARSPSCATAPLGIGSVQRFVDADFEQHYFTLLRGRGATTRSSQRMCAFDIVVNNTDRKSGHVPRRRRRPPLGHRQRPVASTPSSSCAP